MKKQSILLWYRVENLYGSLHPVTMNDISKLNCLCELNDKLLSYFIILFQKLEIIKCKKG